VAAVFAVHPLRVESVAWIAERKDVLSGVFFMLTLWAYARYCRSEKSLARYAMVIVWFVLGLMSKPMLVTLPFVLLLLDYWPLDRLQQKSQLPQLFREKLPLFVLSVLSCVATVAAQKEAIQVMEYVPLSLRVGNALVAYGAYLGKMIYPASLAVLYPILKDGWLAWQVIAALLLLAALAAGAWVLRRKQPYLLVGWLWYLGMLVPVIGIMQVGQQAYADRYTYLPQIGLYLSATWALVDWAGDLKRRRVALGGLAAVILGVLLAIAHHQTSYWRDSESLWTHTLGCTRDNAVGHYNLGNVLFNQGQIEKAAAHYHNAFQINPTHAKARCNYGLALFQQGRTEEAVAEYRESLQADPDNATTHYNLGNALLKLDRTEEATAQYRAGLQINPDNADAHNNLGYIVLQQGQAEQAIVEFREALRVNPAFANAHCNLGDTLFQQGQTEEAIKHLQKALALQPANIGFQNDLAWLLASAPQRSLRNGARAVELATQANQASGGSNVGLLRTLAAAYAEAGEFSNAVKIARYALELPTARSTDAITAALRREINLYQAGQAFRDAP